MQCYNTVYVIYKYSFTTTGELYIADCKAITPLHTQAYPPIASHIYLLKATYVVEDHKLMVLSSPHCAGPGAHTGAGRELLSGHYSPVIVLQDGSF